MTIDTNESIKFPKGLLKQFRKEMNLDQADVLTKFNIENPKLKMSLATYSRIENGERAAEKELVSILEKLLKTNLRLSIEELTTESHSIYKIPKMTWSDIAHFSEFEKGHPSKVYTDTTHFFRLPVIDLSQADYSRREFLREQELLCDPTLSPVDDCFVICQLPGEANPILRHYTIENTIQWLSIKNQEFATENDLKTSIKMPKGTQFIAVVRELLIQKPLLRI